MVSSKLISKLPRLEPETLQGLARLRNSPSSKTADFILREEFLVLRSEADAFILNFYWPQLEKIQRKEKGSDRAKMCESNSFWICSTSPFFLSSFCFIFVDCK